MLNSRPTSALLQYRLLLNINDQIEAKNSLKQQRILKFKKEALKVAAEQSPSTNIWFYRVLRVHNGHFKGDFPSDLNAAEAVGGWHYVFFSDEGRPQLTASTAVALPSGVTDVNVLVYIVE